MQVNAAEVLILVLWFVIPHGFPPSGGGHEQYQANIVGSSNWLMRSETVAYWKKSVKPPTMMSLPKAHNYPLCFATVVLVAMVIPIKTNAQARGPYYSVNVRGVSMNCRSFVGELVEVYLNNNLNNIGLANRAANGIPYIVINPIVTQKYSDLVTQWWFAHECAHHALPPAANSESNADCFAIRQLRNYGFITSIGQLQAFSIELFDLSGSPMGHLPGPIRAQNIARCALS